MYEKLVRDMIPSIMKAAGLSPEYRVASKSERMSWLLQKSDEELSELKTTPNLDECADVFEVLLAIAIELGHSEDALVNHALAKRVSRGGFSNGFILRVKGP
jgi:predicted house-cleaning noncanonical NTP pyrophosphatase (MazG superfamily)